MIALVVVVLYALLALMAIPLVLSWRTVARHQLTIPGTIALTVFTLSYLCSIALLLRLPMMPGDYTVARSRLIDLNLIADLLALMSAFIGRQSRRLLIPTGACVIALWLYLSAVSVVV